MEESRSKYNEMVGEKLCDLRKVKKLRLKDVEKKTGISASTISNYENGKSTPSIDTLQILLTIYGTTVVEFLGIEAADYSKDSDVFIRYGLSASFYQQLLINHVYKGQNSLTECINLIFEHPMYSHTVFDGLSHFFDYKLHEQIKKCVSDSSSIPFPNDVSQRMLLEPVIKALISIFNDEYADKRSDSFAALQRTQAIAYKGLREQLANLAQHNENSKKTHT